MNVPVEHIDEEVNEDGGETRGDTELRNSDTGLSPGDQSGARGENDDPTEEATNEKEDFTPGYDDYPTPEAQECRRREIEEGIPRSET